MEKHLKLTDEEFEAQFRNCKLDPTIFTHEAHLRLAWIHVQSYGCRQAEDNIQDQLQKFVEHVGATGKYNATLTVAAIRMVALHISTTETDSFTDFIAEFPKLKSDFKGLIGRHYSLDIFSSELAKKTFIEPDLQPF